MNSQLFNLFACALLGVAGLSCRRADVPDAARTDTTSSSAVAVVAGAEISEAALRAELQRRFRHAPESGLTIEQKLDALERLIQNEAVYAQVQASGFEQSPEMQARIKSMIIAQFREQRFTNAAPVVSESEIEAAYRASGERFAQAASARGAAIFISMSATATPEKKAETRARAEAVLSEARAVDDQAFAQLALRHSEDQASRYRGGDLGWISRGTPGVDAAMAEALLALDKPGDFASLVETPRGFYVARLVEKREAGRKPLAEVKETIRYQIAREKAAQAERDFHAAMKSGLDIQINHALLDSISLPAEKNDPPRLPGANTAQVH